LGLLYTYCEYHGYFYLSPLFRMTLIAHFLACLALSIMVVPLVGYANVSITKTLTTPNTLTTPIRSGDVVSYQIDIVSVGTGYSGLVFSDMYDGSRFLLGGIGWTRLAWCPSVPTNQVLSSSLFTSTAGIVTGQLGEIGTGCTIRLVMTGILTNALAPWDTVINTWLVRATLPTLVTGQSVASFFLQPYTAFRVTSALTRIDYRNGSFCVGAACQAYGSGDRVTFRMTLTNTGNVSATGNLQTVIAPWWAFVCESSAACLQDIVLAPWATVTRDVTLVLQTNQLTPRTMTATLREWAAIRSIATVSWSTLGRSIVTLTKTSLNNQLNQGPYYPWQMMQFRLTFDNTQGTRLGTWLFVDTLPINLVFESAVVENPAAWSISANASSFTYSVNTGQSLSVLLTTRVLGTKGDGVGQSFLNTWVVASAHPGVLFLQDIASAAWILHPRTEMSIGKEYLGMDGNGRHPFGQWYGTWQEVGFRVTVTNTGNTTMTGIRIRDVLPASLTYVSANIAPVSTTPLEWVVTVPRDGTVSFILTWRLTTQIPQSFTNTASFVDTSLCTPPVGAGVAGAPLCRIILTPTALATWQILGMAYVGIEKTTLTPFPTRFDARNPSLALTGPALPGDLLWFRLRLTNTGTRVATWLRVSDVFSAFVRDPAFATMPGLRLHQVWSSVIGMNQGNDQTATWDVVDIPAGGFVDVIITGMWMGATGIDVNRIHFNTWIVLDPLTQSWVVIVWGTPAAPRATSRSSFVISEYMQGRITKTLLPPANIVGALSGDQANFRIDRANIGNTGMFFFIEDTLPSVLRFESGLASVTVPNSTPWWNYANGFAAIGTVVGTDHIPAANFQGQNDDQRIRRYHAPARYLPVNSAWSIPSLLTRVTSDTFGTVTNTVRLWYDDDRRRFQWATNSFRGQAQASVDLSSRSRLVFDKRRITQNPNDAGDLVGFEIRVTNTWFSARQGPLYIVDTFDPAFTIIATSPTATPTAWASEVMTRSVPNATIPGQSTLSFFLTWRLNTAGWTYGDEFQNTAVIMTGQNWLVLATVVATWVIGEPRLSLTKTRLTPNPYIPWDSVVFRLRIDNNGAGPATVQLRDTWPSDLLDFQSASIGSFNSQAGQTLIWNNVVVPATGLDILMTWVVRQGILPSRIGSWFVNTGEIRFGLNNQFTRLAIATWRIEPGMGMSMRKRALVTGASLGDEVTFRLDFRNTGNVAINFDVLDFWPAELDFVSANLFVGIVGPDGTCGWGNAYPWEFSSIERRVAWFKDDLPILQPWDHGCALLVWRVNAPSYTCITNRAQINFEDANRNQPLFQGQLSRTSEDAVCANVILHVQKNHRWLAPQRAWDPVSFEIVITNSGSAAATNVWILDSFPPEIIANATVQTSFSPAWWQQPLIPTSFVNALLRSGTAMVPTIPPQGSLRLVITWFLNDTASTIGTLMTNRVCVRPSPVAASMEVCDDAVVDVQPLPDLYIRKTLINQPQAMSWFDTQFQITIGNSGARAVTGIRVEDTLSEHFVFTSQTLASSLFSWQSYNPASRTLTLSDITLAPWQEHTFTLNALVRTWYQSGAIFSNTARIFMPLGQEAREVITQFAPITNNVSLVTGALAPFSLYDLLMTPAQQSAVSGSLVTVDLQLSWWATGNVLLVATIPSWFALVEEGTSPWFTRDDTNRVSWFLTPSMITPWWPSRRLVLSPLTAAAIATPQTVRGELFYTAFPFNGVGGPQVTRSVTINPMADLVIAAALTWFAPQLSGDVVEVCFTVSNIWWLAVNDARVYLPSTILDHEIDFREYRLDNGAWTTWTRSVVSVIVPGHAPAHVRTYVWASSLVQVDGIVTLAWGQTRNLCIRGRTRQQYPRDTAFSLNPAVVTDAVEFTGLYYAGIDRAWLLGNAVGNTATVSRQMLGIPDVYVQKTLVSVQPSISGDVVEFALTIGNSWSQAISWFEVRDVFPSQLTYLSWLFDVFNELGSPVVLSWARTVVWSWWQLLPWQERVLTLQFVMNANYPAGTCFTNTGSISLLGNDVFLERGRTANNASWSRVCSQWSPDLWVRKEILQWQTLLQSGDIVSYRISFGNSGTAHISWFVLTDTLNFFNSQVSGFDQWLTGIVSSIPWSIRQSSDFVRYFGTWLAWVFGVSWQFVWWLAPGQQWVILLSGRLLRDYPVGSMLRNTVSIDCSSQPWCEGFSLANNSGTVTSIVWWASDLVMTKTHSWFLARSGDVVTFVLDVENQGTTVATWPIVLLDTLPAWLGFVSWSTRVMNRAMTMLPPVSPTMIWWALRWSIPGNLAVGDGYRVTFQARLLSQLSGGTLLINTGLVEQQVLEYSFVNNIDTDVVEVGDVPGVSIVKTLVQSMSWVMWQEMEWNLEIFNNARPWTGMATGVLVYDFLPQWFVWWSPLCVSSRSDISCSYSTGSNRVDSSSFSLDGGERVSLRVRGRLNYQPLTGFCVTNTWFVDLFNDLFTGDNTSAVSTCIASPVGVAFTKTAQPSWLGSINPAVWLDLVNASLWFTVTLRNTWLIPLPFTTVLDTLTSAWGFVWASWTQIPTLATWFVLAPWQEQVWVLNGQMTRRDFGTIVNEARAFLSWSLQPLIATVTVPEPAARCSDLILSRGEQCELLAGWWVLVASGLQLFEWQVCRNCQIVTERVVNCAEICTEGFCTRACDNAVIQQPQPFLWISKTVTCFQWRCSTASGTRNQGDIIEYLVRVTNTWSVTATNVLVTDTWPAGVELLSLQPSPAEVFTFSSGSTPFQWVISSLAPNQTANLILRGRITVSTKSLLLNTACVQWDGERICANVETCVNCVGTPPTPRTGDIVITKTATPSTVSSWDMITFRIRLANQTSGTVDNIALTDVWPDDVLSLMSRRFVSGSPISWPTSGTALFSSIPVTLTAGWSVELELIGRVRVSQDLSRQNLARATFVLNGSTQTREAPAPFTIRPFGETCQALTPRETRINVTNDQSQTVTYTCTAAPGVTNPRIRFNCGLGWSDVVVDGSVLTASCTFASWWTYSPRCFVNDQTSTQCQATTIVTNQPFGVCGNGRVDAGEKCDLGARRTVWPDWWLDTAQTVRDLAMVGRTCTAQCDLVGENDRPVAPAQLCTYSDVPLSVMPGEILPLRWDIWYDDNVAVASCNDAGSNGKIVRGSLRCTFRVYHQGREPVSFEQELVTNCAEDRRWSSLLFQLFARDPLYSSTVQFADGKTSMQLGTAITDFWEYKLSLDRVEYDYCDNGAQRATSTARVCQSNFTIVPPYFVQQGITSMRTDAVLDRFWNMDGTRTLSGVALANVQRANASVINPTAAFRSRVEALVRQYTSPSLLATTTIGWQTLSKVRGRDIYVLPAGATYREVSGLRWPLAIIAQGDLTIEWDIRQATMIVAQWRISFTKADCSRQLINGIVVALWWFAPDATPRRNTDLTKERCVDGWVTVEWAMIGDGLDALVQSKRSQLNRWFTAQWTRPINETRAELIYNGWAVSIKYNPWLWRSLPPIANEIGRELETFR